MDFYRAVRLRVASHRFDKREIPRALLLKILQAGNMAPSPENYQPWEFVVIRNKDTKQKLAKLKLESRRRVLKDWYPNITSKELNRRLQRNKIAMETAPVFIAVCYKDLDTPAEVRNLKVSISLTAAWTCITHIWLAATAEGLGLSPTFYSHPFYGRAKSLIGLPKGYELASVLRVGFPVKRPLGRKKSIIPLRRKLHEEKF